jgi:bacterioferritin (cytochrome b1)
MTEPQISRAQLIDRLNEDLAREYQAIIAYVVYSQVLKGAEYMNIAQELEVHAGEELHHAITIAKQIDYLGGMPTATATKLLRLPSGFDDALSNLLQVKPPTREKHTQERPAPTKPARAKARTRKP